MADIQANGWGASVKANLETSKDVSAAISRVTLSAFAYLRSQQPTVMHGCPKFTPTARKALGRSVDEFHEKYGSHFVYGYRAAAYALAQVEIETKSFEDSQKLAASLSGSFNRGVASVEGGAKIDIDLSSAKEAQ